MPIDWREIDGWFDDSNAMFYRMAAQWAAPDAVFLEVGSWLGRSTVCLAQTSLSLGKRPRIIAVDTWLGTRNDESMQARRNALSGQDGTVRSVFDRNIVAAGVGDLITAVQMDSVEAAMLLPAASVDFVFIDAEHTYEAVRRDLEAWLPVVRPGGLIGGHDAGLASVWTAVAPQFQNKVFVVGGCWGHFLSERPVLKL